MFLLIIVPFQSLYAGNNKQLDDQTILYYYSLGWATPEQIRDDEEIIDQVMEIGPPFELHYQKINLILEGIEKKLNLNSDGASLWYDKALAYIALLNISESEKSLGGLVSSNIYANNYLKQAHDAMVKMIRFDSNETPNITAQSYRLLVPYLSDKLKTIVYQRMLKTPFYGETDDIRTGDYFQYSNAYFRMGEYDKAIEVLNQMMAEKKAGNSDISVTSEYIQTRIQEVENKKLEMAQANQHDQYSQVSEPITEPYATATGKTTQTEPEVVADAATAEEPKPAPENQ
jgi:pentatricopeptide repeat protein